MSFSRSVRPPSIVCMVSIRVMAHHPFFSFVEIFFVMTVDSNGTTAKFLPTPSVRRATLFVKWRNVPDRFLPTPSARRATDVAYRHPLHADISTHALREEGDQSDIVSTRLRCYFYPRPPRGGRPVADLFEGISQQFLPTPSARRATFRRLQKAGALPGFLPTPSARRAT